MEVALSFVALITLLHLLFTMIEFAIGFRQIKNLSQEAILSDNTAPKVSIILAALNEEQTISQAMRSLLALDYPNIEIIAVNDRSTDKTPYLLEMFKKEHPSLQVIHIEILPENWLGKSHALSVAAQRATGDWLLFTDADVLMERSVVKKALSFVLRNHLDHLTIFEHHIRHHFWLSVLLLGNYVTYSMSIKPWRVRFSWSKKYLGHGAFNLIRRSAYHQSGGHFAIAMECLDDLMLGKLLKEKGYKQDVVDGRDFVKREWYDSLRAMIDGLRKNSFAYFDFKLLSALHDSVFALIYFCWPLLATIFLSGMLKWINIANVLVTLVIATLVANQFRLNRLFALFYPAAILLLLYTVWNSVFFTYKNQGIIWRDTHYSLEKLRAKKLPNI